MMVRFVSQMQGPIYLCLEVDVPCLPGIGTLAYLPGTGEIGKGRFVTPFRCGSVTYLHRTKLFVVDEEGGEFAGSRMEVDCLLASGWWYSDHPFEERAVTVDWELPSED